MRIGLRMISMSFLVLLTLWRTAAQASDFSGLYQGSGQPVRYLEIAHKKGGGYEGQIFYPGDAGGNDNGNTISTITATKSTITFTYDKRRGTFKGTLSADGKSLTGTWQVDGPPSPLTFARIARNTVLDTSPHTTHMVTVDKGVTLEVLDWSGDGPPLVFLTGLGDDAHVFDQFAPRFTAHHHVYAITRRGAGISSIPTPNPQNYDANRLGDDVVAVLDALKLDHPFLAGHSIAGEELSSVGVRHPGRVAGLIYLDAGYGYALYAPGGQIAFGSNLTVESKDFADRLTHLIAVARDPKALPGAISSVQAGLFDLETDLKSMQAGIDEGEAAMAGGSEDTLEGRVASAILDGERKFTHIDGPILAIYAVPPREPPGLPDAIKKGFQRMSKFAAVQADAFAAANPQAHVVRLPNTIHYVFRSNADDVEREMNAFMDGLR